MLRPLRLAQIALTAELLRLRHRTRRVAIRAAYGMVALLLLLGALLFLHIAVWYWLREYMAAHFVALIFMGFDLVLAGILGAMAFSSSPGVAEQGALAVRERALDDAADSLSVSALLVRLIELISWTRARRR